MKNLYLIRGERKLLEKIIDFIFPNICGFCGRINKNSLCTNCENMLSHYRLEYIQSFKGDQDKYFDFLYCALEYQGEIRKKIISYKFEDKSYLYKTFTKIIINNKKIYDILELYDIILSVPMCKNKEAVRGYNQSALIAKELAKNINIEFYNNILIKIKDTEKQSTLNKEQRQENIKDAFFVKNKNLLNNKNIVLFDDIYTTGSTVNECSKVLKRAGAKKIFVLTLAKD